jgi:hypothetical protein
VRLHIHGERYVGTWWNPRTWRSRALRAEQPGARYRDGAGRARNWREGHQSSRHYGSWPAETFRRSTTTTTQEANATASRLLRASSSSSARRRSLDGS